MTYYVPRGGLPPQTALTTDRATFTDQHAAAAEVVNLSVVESAPDGRLRRLTTFDEGDLAESRGVLVAGADRAHGLRRGVGVDLHGAAALEADAQPAHDGSVHQHERLGRGDLAVDARRVG